MKTFILGMMLALTAVSGIVVASTSAQAHGTGYCGPQPPYAVGCKPY